MRTLAAVILFVTLSANQVMAKCPNGCSGHGNCDTEDVCQCWANWQGADCSLRTCPFGTSWNVDEGGDHPYEECSNRGLCDRTTGDCECFDGYSGRACQRTTCPNGCSGHGKCRYISELDNVGTYTDWDAKAIQTCVCDGGYTGSDCSQRLCPRGDDPLTACESMPDHQTQKLTISWPGSANAATPTGNHLVLKYTDPNGEVWTTRGIVVENAWDGTAADATIEAEISSALTGLPNFVISNTDVTHATSGSMSAEFDITLYGQDTFGNADLTLGKQTLLDCLTTLGCTNPGCQPRHSQIRKEDVENAAIVDIHMDSVITPSNTASGTMWDETVVITVSTPDVDSADSNYRFSANIYAGDSSTGSLSLTVPLQPIPANYGQVYIGHGLYVAFGSRTPTAGSYYIKYAIPSCTVTEAVAASTFSENAECSNRGACDRETGTCKCFDGYYGHNCAQQSILV